MNELNELKKKFGELFDILKRLFRVRADKAWHWLNEGKTTGMSLRAVGVMAIGCVMIGLLLGSFMKGSGVGKAGGKPASEHFSVLRYLFGKSIPVPGAQADGSFVFANFEKDSDLKGWTMKSAKLEITSSHPSEGRKAGQVSFLGDVEVSSITLEDYFESRRALTNWSSYEFLAFDIFNPQSDSERLILQVKDRDENRFKMNLQCPAAQTYSFKIPLRKMDGQVNLKEITQAAIFRWEPKIETLFYIDNIRLVPADVKAAEGKPGVSSSDNSEAFFEKAPPPRARPVNIVNYGFDKVKQFWSVVDPYLNKEMVRVPFIVKDEAGVARDNAPAQGGVPFPPGELASEAHIKIRNAAWEEFPFQTRVLARWPDQSIRWLQVDIQSRHDQPLGGQGYFLDYGTGIERPEFSSPLKVDETPETIRVETGPMAFTVSRKNFYLFDEVYVDLNGDKKYSEDELAASKIPLSLSFRGKTYYAHLDSTTFNIAVEEKGPEKIGLKANGWFQAEDGKRFCQWIVRIHAFKGKSFARVYHTFVYTGYPQNRYNEKYKGLKLPENETIEAVQINIPLRIGSRGVSPRIDRDVIPAKAGIQSVDPRLRGGDSNTVPGKGKEIKVTFGVEGAPPVSFIQPSSLAFYQDAFDSNRVEVGGALNSEDIKVLGWMDASDTSAGVAVAVRDFKENFPKEYAFDGKANELYINIWPKRAGDLDLQTTADAYGPEAVARGSAFGLAKTHELFFYFHKGGAQEAKVDQEARGFNEPLVIRVNPYWIDRTGALGRLYPADQKYAAQEAVLERLFDWAARQPRNFKWYGMINFGDTMSWHRHEDDDKWYPDAGWHPVGRWGWYNCENAGTHSGALLQYVRSGKWKYFDFGENLARHIMDIDTVHYNTIAGDPRLKIIDDEFSQVGSMHRHNGNHWGDRNEETTHTNVYGILLYYYLTGYERAFDVAKEVGGFFLQNRHTYTGHPDAAPHRGFANALWGDVLLYQATWDERFKQAADRLMEVYLKGQKEDGSYLEWYSPMTGEWYGEVHNLYMAYYAIRAFIAYHELTQDKEVLEALEKMARYVQHNKELSPSVINAMAYLYLSTHNEEFIRMAEQSFQHLINQQQTSSDSLIDGIIYKKLIYHRPNVYLFSVPWIFAAFEESFEKRGL
ncbi:MAG: glycoside hydrolase family 127 protein [Candidatus Omnitrophica bacterium]|nr:glycoside hydrolase family 127 protein [Candidatus Omnitrophota bacterium]